MKKLLSVLAGLVMLLNLSPFHSRSSESEKKDLNSLAESLGADTDFLNVVNYSHASDDMVSEEVFQEYLDKCSLLEAVYSPIHHFNQTIISGSDMGISIVEILSHNGVISPNEIQKNAKKLSEVTFDEELDKLITTYQVTQSYANFNNYIKYISFSLDYEKQIERLITTAEKCMDNKRYFLINIHGKELNHNMCGIGIADGKWEWNDKVYDKCILTLDSNVVKFSEKSCIYINSDTMESIIPAYEFDMNDEPKYAAFDDDSLLNFRGAINPSYEIDDKYKITDFKYIPSKYSPAYTVKKGVKTLIESQINEYKKTSVDLFDFDYLRVEMNRFYKRFPMFIYSNANRWVEVFFEDCDYMRNPEYKGAFEINDNFIRIVNENDAPFDAWIDFQMNNGTYDFEPFFMWDFHGQVEDDLTIEVVEKGMLLKSSGRIDMNVTPYRYITDENGDFQYVQDYYLLTGYAEKDKPHTENDILITIDEERKIAFYADKDSDGAFEAKLSRHEMSNENVCRIISDNDVLVTVNDDYKIQCYIDDNSDGIFDTPVVKGDANYDGVVNSADANSVLTQYGRISTSVFYVYSDLFAMDFNNDGNVNSADALGIFCYYSKNQTS